MDLTQTGGLGLPTGDIKSLIASELKKNPMIAQAAAAGEGVQELITLVTDAPDTIKRVVQSAVDEKLAAAGLPTDGSSSSYPESDYSNEYSNEAVPEETYEGAGGGNTNENYNDINANDIDANDINANTLEEIANALENIPNAEGGGEVMYEGYGGEGLEYGVQGGGFQEGQAMEGLTVYQNQSGGYFVEQPVIFNPQTGGFYIMDAIADILRAQQGGFTDEFTDPTAEELAAATTQGGARRSRAYRHTYKISGQGIRQMAKASSRRSSRRAGTRKNRRNARRGTRRNARRNNGNGM